MKLEVVDLRSIASGSHNEDRAGAEGPLAWVIDGATDVLPQPLTHAPTDAVWFAEAMHATMRDVAARPPSSLSELPEIVAARLAPRFAAETKRAAMNAGEHPSAAAIVIRLTAGRLEYVSLGDCALIAENAGHWSAVGVDEANAGDRWVADALRGHALDATSRQAPLTRADLLPRLRAQRARMNTADGYGIFSVTAPPPSMVGHGTLPVAEGTRILLATDGLMRLVDVFGRYDKQSLFASAWSRGLAPLFGELRALEHEDRDCAHFPRAKVSDDTTAMLLRVTAPA